VVDAALIELAIGTPKKENFGYEKQTWRTRLFAARKYRKMTLKQAAEKLDISISHLCRLEHGCGDLSLRLARRIAEFYGYTVEYLWLKLDSPPENSHS
jgi:transcriptional regulator with XRE-family HTH domain